jgi:hypothetical protein
LNLSNVDDWRCVTPFGAGPRNHLPQLDITPPSQAALSFVAYGPPGWAGQIVTLWIRVESLPQPQSGSFRRRAMAEYTKKTQVLCLPHYTHLVEIGKICRRAGDAPRVFGIVTALPAE